MFWSNEVSLRLNVMVEFDACNMICSFTLQFKLNRNVGANSLEAFPLMDQESILTLYLEMEWDHGELKSFPSFIKLDSPLVLIG